MLLSRGGGRVPRIPSWNSLSVDRCKHGRRHSMPERSHANAHTHHPTRELFCARKKGCSHSFFVKLCVFAKKNWNERAFWGFRGAKCRDKIMHGYSLSPRIPRVRFNPVLDVFHVGRLCTMQLFGVTAQLKRKRTCNQNFICTCTSGNSGGTKTFLRKKKSLTHFLSVSEWYFFSLSCFLKTKCCSRRVVEGFRQLEWFSVFVSFSLTHTFTMQYFCIRSVGQDNKSCFSFSSRPKIRSCDFPSCTKQPKLSCSVQGLPHFPIWSFLLGLLLPNACLAFCNFSSEPEIFYENHFPL